MEGEPTLHNGYIDELNGGCFSLEQRGYAPYQTIDRPVFCAVFGDDLRCGILAHGFARVYCAGCGHDFLVAFSCKGRDICPSCSTRRMVEAAAHMVDEVLHK